jgi:hypothetical protein
MGWIPARDAKIYPYLLEGLTIERPNQMWSSDLRYLPMAHGFLYLGSVENLLDQRHSSASSPRSRSLGEFELADVRSMFRFRSESASTRAGPAGTR